MELFHCALELRVITFIYQKYSFSFWLKTTSMYYACAFLNYSLNLNEASSGGIKIWSGDEVLSSFKKN